MRIKTAILLLIIPSLCIAEVAKEASVNKKEFCKPISDKLSSVGMKECQRRNLSPSSGASVNGLPILIKEYAPLPSRKPLGRVMLLGGIHGDEYSSVTITFKWMETLDRYHSGLFHWKVFPLVNPDGLLRKKSQRMNENGVDLNRNFPTPDWKKESSDYWVRRTRRNPRRYPGPEALSEPETRWLAQEIDNFQPDVIISVHAPHGILDFDGPHQAPRRLGNLHLHLLGTYPGSLGNYAGVVKQIPVVTIELPSAGIMPSPYEISRIWTDLVKWLRHKLPQNARLSTQTLNDKTGQFVAEK